MAPGKTHVKKKNNVKPKLFKHKKKKPAVSEAIKTLTDRYEDINISTLKIFSDFPLSKQTLKGLKDNGFTHPTEIQKQTIGFGLQGKDVLAAAQTGSGKTLAFLIPVLESLYIKRWTNLDGLGALIISPTRELAYQTFETLKKVGQHHDFSAGLVIGGKDLHFEKDRMDQCNIVVCTPGRILHHMDVNPLFNCTGLQVLVLDEADRCLDLGFAETMNHILENLPPERQTLLFSATQTRSVRDLARLSLKEPRYVAVRPADHIAKGDPKTPDAKVEVEETGDSVNVGTPAQLSQSYVMCELEDKLSMLWSFLKNHSRQKTLVFLSSCKQVKFVYQLFCRLRPGIPLLALYGTLHQLRRMKIYNEFCAKQRAAMFATDIAARGLDIPSVDWVLQLDCPEDTNTYIHRAGRTARYNKGGESLLVLLESERGMVQGLQAAGMTLDNIQINPSKLTSPIRKIEALLARDPNLKADAQRAFVAYVKWVYLMKNKDVFQVEKLNLERFARSLGLVVTPRVRFLKGRLTEKVEKVEEESSGEEFQEEEETNQSEDELLTLKRRNHEIPTEGDLPEIPTKKSKTVTKAALAKKLLKKKIVANRKTVFDETTGEMIANKGRDKFTNEARHYEMEDKSGIDIETARKVLKAEDKFDKKLFRDRVKEKHKERKNKLRKDEEEEDVRLGSGSEEGSEPDLSWMPDPDLIYGKEGGEGQEEEGKKEKKRKRKEEVFETGLSLAEDEELALRLLQAHR